MSNERILYLQIGGAIGILPAIGTFVGSWWYCTATYGYLFGFGLGWLPSIILAALVFFAIMFLWGIAVLGAGALVLTGNISLSGSKPPKTQQSSFLPSSPSNITTSEWGNATEVDGAEDMVLGNTIGRTRVASASQRRLVINRCPFDNGAASTAVLGDWRLAFVHMRMPATAGA